MLFCVIDIFSKYTWVIPLKDKNYIKKDKKIRITVMLFNALPN